MQFEWKDTVYYYNFFSGWRGGGAKTFGHTTCDREDKTSETTSLRYDETCEVFLEIPYKSERACNLRENEVTRK